MDIIVWKLANDVWLRRVLQGKAILQSVKTRTVILAVKTNANLIDIDSLDSTKISTTATSATAFVFIHFF